MFQLHIEKSTFKQKIRAQSLKILSYVHGCLSVAHSRGKMFQKNISWTVAKKMDHYCNTPPSSSYVCSEATKTQQEQKKRRISLQLTFSQRSFGQVVAANSITKKHLLFFCPQIFFTLHHHHHLHLLNNG